MASVCLDVLGILDQVMVTSKGSHFSGQWCKNLRKAISNWETTLKNNRVRDTVYGESTWPDEEKKQNHCDGFMDFLNIFLSVMQF